MNFITLLNIKQRVWLVCSSIFLLFSLFIVWNTWNSKSDMLRAKQDKLESVVDIANSIVKSQAEQVSRGKLSKEQAQNAAKQIIEQMRYLGNEYLWIHNTDGIMVMHPIKPNLNGQDVNGIKDPNGKALFVEMTRLVKRKNKGVVDYYWPKPGSDHPVAKTDRKSTRLNSSH